MGSRDLGHCNATNCFFFVEAILRQKQFSSACSRAHGCRSSMRSRVLLWSYPTCRPRRHVDGFVGGLHFRLDTFDSLHFAFKKHRSFLEWIRVSAIAPRSAQYRLTDHTCGLGRMLLRAHRSPASSGQNVGCVEGDAVERGVSALGCRAVAVRSAQP